MSIANCPPKPDDKAAIPVIEWASDGRTATQICATLHQSHPKNKTHNEVSPDKNVSLLLPDIACFKGAILRP